MKKLFTLLTLMVMTTGLWAQFFPCEASYTWTATNNGTVSFTNTSESNGNGSIASFFWNFGDGTSSTDGSPVHTFSPNTLPVVCLTITTSNGCSSTFCDTITWGNPNNCTAGFTATVANNNPMLVIFNGTFNGQVNNNATYVWDFGDNTVATGGPVQDHIYTSPGTYTVCVTVTNDGCTDTYCGQVTVGNNLNCNPAFTITPLNIINTYAYYLDPVVDGGTFTVTPATGVQISPSGEIFISNAGNYTICYTVTQNGQTCDHCETIVVGGSNTGCTSDFTWVANPNGGTQFTNNADSNNNGNIAFYQWSFGDGSGSTQANPDHMFTPGQWYLVCLTITTSNGCTSTSCDSVMGGSNTGGCQASFTYTQGQNNTMAYHFMSSNSGSQYLIEWSIDGVIYTPAYDEQDFNIVFGDSGLHVVCLTITDNNGCSDTQCQTIYINNGNPNGGGCDPAFTATFNNNILTSVQFIPVPNQSVTHLWSFGDGSSSTNVDPIHIYDSPGTYYVCHTISGVNCQATYCDSVTVGNGGGFLGGTITGSVYTSNNSIADVAYVFLLRFDYPNSALVPQDAGVSANGGYLFSGVPNGDYLVKAALTPNDPLYAVRIPTYHTSAEFWFDGDVITVNNDNHTADIYMIAATNPGGPGFIGGSVDWADTLRASFDFSGATVILRDLNGNNIAYAIADADGSYSFSNIAYGTYHLYADFPGYTGDPTTVTISANTPSVNDAPVLLGPANLTSVEETSVIDGISLFPNPTASDATLVVETSKTAQIRMTIVNMMGQVVGTQTINTFAGKNMVQLNTNSLAQGVYTLVLRDSKGVAKVERLVKQ